jgi:hypothetical protein
MKVLFIAFSILFNLPYVSYASDDAEFQEAGGASDSVDLIKRGWVDRRLCTHYCAALGDPYRYNVYPAFALKEASFAAIQEVGFAINPDSKGPPIGECKLLREKYANFDDNQFFVFWTDFVILDDSFVSSLKITWQAIGIVPSSGITYRLQLAGCYYTEANGAAVPFSNPGAARLPEHWVPDRYWTQAKLIMTVLMEKRASKSAFVPTAESVKPKSILDVIKQRIELKAKEVEVLQLITDSTGKVWN